MLNLNVQAAYLTGQDPPSPTFEWGFIPNTFTYFLYENVIGPRSRQLSKLSLFHPPPPKDLNNSGLAHP